VNTPKKRNGKKKDLNGSPNTNKLLARRAEEKTFPRGPVKGRGTKAS